MESPLFKIWRENGSRQNSRQSRPRHIRPPGHVELDLALKIVPKGFAILAGSWGVDIEAKPMAKDI